MLDYVVGLTPSLVSPATRLMRVNVIVHSLEKMIYRDLSFEELSAVLSFNDI
ncbi:MAG TPA: hypothetical protein VGS11_07710 [Candidatus Bathyarchaeia archaeon]|nr:hypothetical protein [Candidatus Bathyarchaeia archaeon]